MARPRFPMRDGVAASRLQLPPGPWTTVLQALVARFPQVPEATWRDRIARGRVRAWERANVPGAAAQR